MSKNIVDIQTALAIALASIPTLSAVLWSMWQHNKRVDDARELLRAEIKSSTSEVLLAVETVKQRIEITSSKLSSLEQDIKRSIYGIDSINDQFKEFVHNLAEQRVKIETLREEEKQQRLQNAEIRKEIASVIKITSGIDSIDSTLKSFELRLNEIEQKYINTLNEYIERVIKKLDK